MKISKTPASLLLSFSAYLAFSSGLLALDNLSGTVTSADALSYEDVIVTGDLNLTGNGILFNGDISSSGPPPELQIDAGSGTVVFNSGDYMSFSTIRVLSDSNISGLFRAQTVDLQGDVSLTGNLKVEAGEIRPNLNLTEAPVFTYDFVEQNGSSNGSYMGRGRGAYLSPDLDKLLFNSEYFGTRIFDFSDPTNPVLFGGDDNITVFYDPLENNTTEFYHADFSKDGNEVFVAHLSGYFASYDISDPTNPVFLDDLNFSELTDNNLSPNLYEFDLSSDGNLAAVIDQNNRIFIVDVNDSSNLSVQSSLDLNLTANLVTWQGIQFSNNDQYVIAGTSFKYSAFDFDHNITIYDTSSASLNKVSSIEIGSNFDSGGGIWETVLSKDGNTIYAGGFGSVVAVDVSDPNNPSKLWERTTYDYHGTNVTINTYGMSVSADGKTLFLSDWNNKTVVGYDISDPSNPVELGSIPLDSVSGINDSPNFNRMTSTPDGKYIIPSTFTWDEDEPPTAMAVFEVPYELLGDGNVTFDGKIDGAFDLSTNDFNGSLIFRDSIGSQTPLASINIENNKSTLFDFSGSVTTTGDQNYSGLVTSTGSMDFNGGGAGSFQNINMGGNNLDLNFSNGVSINGSIAEIDHLSVLGDLTLTDGFNGGLNSISVDGTSTLAGDFTTDGNQSYGKINITSPYGEVTSFATGTGTLYAGNIYGSGRDVSLGDSNQTGSIYLNALQSNSLITAASNYDLTIGSASNPTPSLLSNATNQTIFNNTGTLTFEGVPGVYNSFFGGITATEPSEVIVSNGGVYTFAKDMNMSNVTISAFGNSHVRFDTTWTQVSGVIADGANITINGFREDDSFNATYLEFNLGSGTENIGRFTGDINMSTDTLRYLSGNGAFEFDGNLTLAGEITPPHPYNPSTGEIRNGFSTNFNADVNLSGATEIQLPNSVTFANGINAHGNDLTLDLNGTTFDLSQLSNVNNFTLETNASVSGAFLSGGFQKYNDSLTLLNDSSLSGTELNASSILGGGFDLDLNFSETASFYNISNIKDLHSLGNVSAGGTILTSQSQTYDGTVSLVDDSNFTGTSFVSSGTIAGGGFDLTLDFAESNISLANVSNVANLLVESNASTNGNLSTTGSQTYNGSFSLLGDSNLSGTTLVMASVIQADGNGLDLNFSDSITMSGATGLTSISVDGNLTAEGLISSTGAQSFEDKITLSDDLNLTSGSGTIAINSGVSGASAGLKLGDGSQTGSVTLREGGSLGSLAIGNGSFDLTLGLTDQNLTIANPVIFENSGTVRFTTADHSGLSWGEVPNFQFNGGLDANSTDLVILENSLISTSQDSISLNRVKVVSTDDDFTQEYSYLSTFDVSDISEEITEFSGNNIAIQDLNVTDAVLVALPGSSNLLTVGNLLINDGVLNLATGDLNVTGNSLIHGIIGGSYLELKNLQFDGNVTLTGDSTFALGNGFFANGIEGNNHDLSLNLANDLNLSDFRNVKNFLSEGNITALGDFSTSGSQTYNGSVVLTGHTSLIGTGFSLSSVTGNANNLTLSSPSGPISIAGVQLSGVNKLTVGSDAEIASNLGGATEINLQGNTTLTGDITLTAGGLVIDYDNASLTSTNTLSFDGNSLTGGSLEVAISADGKYAYAGDFSGGFYRFDITENIPTATHELVPAGANVYGTTLSADGQYAYVSATSAGLKIFDVSDLSIAPQYVGGVDTPGQAQGVALSPDGGYAYLSDGTYGVQIIDISDPESPTIVSAYNTPDQVMQVVLSSDGNYVFAADSAAGLRIIDVSDKANPTLESNFTGAISPDVPFNAIGVTLSADNNYAYIGNPAYGLTILDVSDVTAPTHVASLEHPGTSYFGTLSQDGSTYIAGAGTGGFQYIDVSDPTTPVLIESIDGNGTAIPQGTVYGAALSPDGLTAYKTGIGPVLQTISLASEGAGTINISGLVDGANDLVLNDGTGGSTTIGAAIGSNTPLASVTSDSGGNLTLSANVSTSGNQTYGDAVQLSSDITLTGANVSLNGGIDGSGNSLSLNATGTATLDGEAGTISDIGELSVTGAADLSGTIATTGSQTYNGTLDLSGNTTLSGTTASFSGAVDGGGNNLNLNMSGVSSLTGGASNIGDFNSTGDVELSGNFSTTGSQTYGGDLSLSGATSLSGSTLTASGVTGNANNLDLNFSGGAISLGGNYTGIADFVAESDIEVDGNFSTSGSQTYNGLLTIGNDLTLSGTSISASNIAGGGNDLDLNFSTTTALRGISGVADLNVTGDATTGGVISTTGSQTYGGTFGLTADSSLSGTTLSVNDIAGGGYDLDLNFSSAVTLGTISNIADFLSEGNVSIGGTIAASGSQTYNGTVSLYADSNLSGTTLGLAGSLNGGNNDLVLDFSEDDLALSNITSVANLTVESNATTNSGISSSGVQTYNGKLTLGGDSNFSGTSFSAANLAGGGFDLDLNFSASTNLSGMNGVDNLTSHGPSSLNGTLSTSGSQTYNGTLFLSGDSNLSGSTFTSAGGIDANNNDLVLDFSQDDVSLSTLSNLASLTIESNATTSSGISSSGAQAYNGKLTLGADSNFSGTNFSAANLSGGGYNLGLNFSGNSNLGGVSNVQNLLSEGNLTAGGVISTLGSQTYNGALVLSADSNFSGTILSANNVSGNGYDLDLNFSGVSSLAGMSGVDNFSSEGSVSTGGTIATTGSQSYNGGLTLSSDSSLSGTTLSSAAIDGGGNNLDLNFSGSTTLSGITNLGNFSSEGDILTSGAFTTNGSQTFNGALTLGGDANFTGSSFSSVNLTGGGFDLDLNFSGTTGLSGVSGVKNITVHGASNLNGTLTTSGSQTFNNTLSLLGDSTLSGTTLSTTSIIGGGNDLTIDFAQDDVSLSAISGVDNFTAESNVSLGGSFVTTGAQTYNGKLTLTADSSLIGSDLTASNIQGGGFDLDLNISNGLSLSGISDVNNLTAATGVVVGGTFESNGSQVYTGGLTLSSDTTLSGTTFSADNVIGGGNDLDLNFSGVSTLSGAANVKDLTVHGSLSASGSLATTGSQTFNETLSLSGDLNLTSGSGTITIDSGVSGSSADLKLGDGAQTGSVALSEGGTLDSLAIGNGSFDLTLGLTDQNLTIANPVIFENSGTVRFTTAEHSGLSLGKAPNFQFNGGLDANSTDLVILENSLISTSQDSISLNRVKVVSTDDDFSQENSYLSTFDVSDISEEITEFSGNNIAIQDLNVTDAVLVALPGSSNLLTVGNLLINDGVLYGGTGDLNVTGNSLIHGQIINFLNPEVMSDQHFEGDVTLTGSSTFVAENGYFTNGIDAQNNDLTIIFGNDHNLSEFRNAANFTAGMSGFENGIIYANGDFETNGSQTYDANLVLSADSSLSGATMTASNSIDGGGNDLNLNFSGTTSLAGFSNMQNFSSQGAVALQGTFESNGTQTYTGSASLSADADLSSNETVNFVAGLDLSGNALVLDAPSISGAIVNSGSLSFNSSADANVSSTISGSGSVTKSGDSTLTLSGTSSYAGSTTVEDGTLEVSGSINQSTVTIEDGASLAGSGSTGSVIVKNGGTISPANADSGGTLSVTGDVTLHAGGNYFFEVIGNPEGVAGTDWDTVSASGNVVIDSSESSPFHVHASKVAGNSFDASAKKYIWELISYGGNITGFNRKSFDVNASGMGSFEGRFYVDQEEDLNALILVYKTASVFVTSEGVWSTANVWEGESIIEDSDSLEFTGPGGTSVNDGFVTLIDDILFTDETTGSYVVSGTGFSLSENGIVNESAYAQEISLDVNLTNDQVIDSKQAALTLSGKIGGAGGIIKRGEHSLTLTGENSYAGGLIIEQGEVRTTTQSVIGNVANAGTLTFDQNFTGTYSEAVSGIGSLIKNGAGEVRLSAANSYSGGTSVREGDLAVNHAQALGTGKVTLDGGNLLVYSAQEMNGSIAITGNFDWNSGNIAYFDTGTSPESEDLLMHVDGNLTNGGSGGNFDFSQVEALDKGTYSLVNYTGSTNFSEANFTTSHGEGTTLLASFTLEDNLIKLIVSGAESSGVNIQNNGGANTPIVSDYKISKVGVITINEVNVIKSLVFENSGTLDIEDNGLLYLSAGVLEADEQNSSSEINGGKLIVGVMGEAPVDLIKSGLGKLKVGSDVEVTGKAIVEDGLLTLNGNVSTVDNFIVESTGVLGGDGTITTPLLAVSGRLAPGNSPGTLNVTGDIDFNSSSFLEIEIENETNFDRLNASGTVNVDGTVVATTWNDGNISAGNRYDIITASSIIGEFSNYQAPDGLRMRFVNQGTIGTLLFAPETYTQFALTPNQRSVAQALDSYRSTSFSIGGPEADTNTVSLALDLLPESAYPAAFEQIMPSFYQNHAKSLLNNGYYQSQSVLNRLSAFRKDNGFEQGLKNKKLWRYWTKYNSSSFNSNVIGENSFFDNEIDSYSLGADYLVDHSLTVGFFANRDINDPSYSNGSRMEDQTTSFGIYSSYADEEGYYFESIAHYGLSDLDTTRTISFSNISRTARSSSTANQFGLGVNFGRDFSSGNFVFGPTASLSFTKLTLDNVVEQGGDSLNLKIDKHSISSLRSTLGARIAYNITTKDFVRIVPEARFSFMHDMRDSQKSMTTYLNGGSGAQFNYVTPALDQDSYLTILGVSALSKKNLSLSAFYNMNSNDTGYESDSLSISVGYSF